MFNKKQIIFSILVMLMPITGFAQGKISVVNLQEAMLKTDLAQTRLSEIRQGEDYSSDKKEFDRLKSEIDELIASFQKDAAVMSAEQQASARQRVANKNADLEHVAGKLQQAEQIAGQALLKEMSPMIQKVLSELIKTEGVGLLLQQSAVIHADPGYSITAKVTDKLNQLSVE